jgi:hypothetical protein
VVAADLGPRWNMMLNRRFDGLKLATLPLNAKVGVFHLMDSVTRSSAARMISRARRIASRGGWAYLLGELRDALA